MLVNSWMPCSASSRPNPDAFVPPNGSRTSLRTSALTKQAPAAMRRAIASPRARSVVQTLAPRPKAVSFATRTASSSSRTRRMLATGPNSSSSYAGIPGATASSTVAG